ncbi:MAG: PIN domain-containing protein [Nitrospiraceae bacterium]
MRNRYGKKQTLCGRKKRGHSELALLDPYPLLDLDRQTYVAAARLRSVCRSKRVNAGPIDFLIAAACCQHGFPLLTADKDFPRIAAYCDLMILPA